MLCHGLIQRFRSLDTRCTTPAKWHGILDAPEPKRRTRFTAIPATKGGTPGKGGLVHTAPPLLSFRPSGDASCREGLFAERPASFSLGPYDTDPLNRAFMSPRGSLRVAWDPLVFGGWRAGRAPCKAWSHNAELKETLARTLKVARKCGEESQVMARGAGRTEKPSRLLLEPHCEGFQGPFHPSPFSLATTKSQSRNPAFPRQEGQVQGPETPTAQSFSQRPRSRNPAEDPPATL